MVATGGEERVFHSADCVMMEERQFSAQKRKLEIINLDERSEAKMAKDPICGMTVNEKTTKFMSEHEGVAFYFCSAQCKKTFDGDPHSFGHPK